MKLVYFSFILLLFSVINFSETNLSVQYVTRVIPVLISILTSFYSLFKLSLRNKISKKTFDFFYFSIFLYVFISFFIVNVNYSDVYMINWSIWKNLEIVAALLWSMVLFNFMIRSNPYIIFESLAKITFYYFLLVGSFALSVFIQEYSFLDLIFSIRPYLSFPVLNPIMYASIAVYILIYSQINYKYYKYKVTFPLFFLVGFILLIISKSRTGILIYLLFIFSIFVYYKGVNKKSRSLIYITIVIITLFFTQASSVLRLDNIFTDGFGGRVGISNTVSTKSSWGESIYLIKENFFFGLGNINFKRFFIFKEYSVDNAILQILLTSGIIGGVLYCYFLILRLPILVKKFLKKNQSFLYVKISLLFFIYIYVRSISTNGLATYSFELLFLLILYNFIRSLKYAKQIK